ncbi:Glutamyl-tRNA amidotransferase B subunit [Panus rudis PR-1116 ss-1]|nr:Glutamyl-tRNA amidotransferase B subunit [Panus rudis PR-1116 ss-1]
MQTRPGVSLLFLRHALRRSAHTSASIRDDPRWPGWGVVIGIEVHAQIKSREKLFSRAWTSDLSEPPNTHVSPFDAAFPGTLPSLNLKCVELGVRTALALNCRVQPRSSFDRKHYFYPDLPSGYQITQHYAPLATEGILPLNQHDVKVRIKQIQLEQDTGKTSFDPRRYISTIDLNRAGTGLMEIVSEPDMRSPEEAGDYVRTLQAILRSVGSSDGNMEQGSFRCDVNVSVHKPNQAWGTRCEIKNLNSIKFMQVAIASEVFRQIELLDNGLPVPQETRGFDEHRAETYTLRSKEDAPDYRYMPDPNLPPLLLDASYVAQIQKTMPDLPHETRARLLSRGLSERDVDVLMSIDMGREVGYDGVLGHGAVHYFDSVSHGRDPKVVANWINHELLGQLALRQQTFRDNPLTVDQLGEIIDLVQNKKITGTSGREILRRILTERLKDRPSALAERMGLLVSSTDSTSLKSWCEEVIAAMPSESQAIRDGQVNVLNKLLGCVMKLSKGRADAKAAKQMLDDLLRGEFK